MFNGYRSARRDNEEDEDNDGVPARQARKRAADAAINHSDPKPPKKRCGVRICLIDQQLIANASCSQRRRQ
jgi:hypothetical protein